MKAEPEFHVLIGSAAASARTLAAVAIATIAILATYFDTAESIVAIWKRAETFAHGYLVVPIVLWLVWRMREKLAALPAKPFWPGVALVALFGAAWLVASTSGVLGLEQFALLFMIQAAIVTIVGLRFARELAFPLFFLVFAVPFGEVFVPQLIDWTADFTVLALRATGIPVFREANHFIVPSGAWSVVEACSGIRYLIASIMVGTLYAHLTYQTRWRKAAFILASILVPLVANWLRAYMIVMLGHLSNNRIAVGVDHLIYGWIFFGVVMALMFWIGSFWREDQPAEATGQAASGLSLLERSVQPARAGAVFAATVAVIVAACIWKPLGAAIDARSHGSAPALAPLSATAGWAPVSPESAAFKPHYQGARAELAQSFVKGGSKVGLYVGYYSDQKQGREMVGSANVLVTPKETRWKMLSSGADSATWTGETIPVLKAMLGSDDSRLLAMRLYWVAGRVTASDYAAKALTAFSKVTGQGDDSAVIVVYVRDEGKGDGAEQTLRDFLTATSPDIERMLASTRGK